MENINLDYEKPMLVSHNGEIKEFIPRHITHFEIDELIDAVGGKLEIVNIPESDLVIIYNEEAKKLNMPENTKAEDLVAGLTGHRYGILGNLIITPNTYMGTYYLP
jgi:hypothetical protein